MDRLDRLEQVVKSQNEAIKELQAEVKALKGEPSVPMPPVGEPLREIVGGINEFIKTKGRTD